MARVSRTPGNGLRGILRKPRVGPRQVAQQETRAGSGYDFSHPGARNAETRWKTRLAGNRGHDGTLTTALGRTPPP